MKYNDGKVHTDFYDQETDLFPIAEEFSEGDNRLRDLLLKMWNKGIRTNACCKGHADFRMPYLSFQFDYNKIELIEGLIEYMYNVADKEEIEVDFVYHNNQFIFSIAMINESVKQKCFDYLNDLIDNKIIVDDSKKELINEITELMILARLRNMSFRFIINTKEMLFSFFEPNNSPDFNNSALSLEEILDDIKEKDSIPLNIISCNEESLKRLLNYLYPNNYKLEEKKKQ